MKRETIEELYRRRKRLKPMEIAFPIQLTFSVPSVLLLTGPALSGKTRLLSAFVAALADRDIIILDCAGHFDMQPFHFPMKSQNINTVQCLHEIDLLTYLKQASSQFVIVDGIEMLLSKDSIRYLMQEIINLSRSLNHILILATRNGDGLENIDHLWNISTTGFSLFSFKHKSVRSLSPNSPALSLSLSLHTSETGCGEGS